MTSRVTITRQEYDSLLNSKLKYDYLQQVLTNDLFAIPPTKNSEVVVKAFENSGKYNKAFIKSLSAGLNRSKYFNK